MTIESRLVTGQLLGDRYIIAGLMGTGGMGCVYLAEDIRLPGKRWAVKESLCPDGNPGAIQSEAELLISLSHRLLPRVADFFPPDAEGYCYLVMDYIEGVTLSQYMAEHPGPLEGNRLISYARALLEVLSYLHGHHPPIIYRDLKPSNVMLTGLHTLMLIDFGIARSYRIGAGEDTEKLGTVGFAAPEQYGSLQSGPHSDLYALGALMLYMATAGQFSRWQPGIEDKLRGIIPDSLIPVIRRLLRYHPEERYQSAEEVLLALAPIEAAAGERIPRYNQQAGNDKHGIILVALLGTASGLGTTHTSFAIASCLSRRGRTAWVDFSPLSPVFERLRSLLEVPQADEHPGSSAVPLEWKGLHFCKRPEDGNMKDLFQQHYSYIVIDLGTGGYEGALEEFAACDVPVLISSGADWRLEDTLHWLRRSGLEPQPGWQIGLPLATSSAAAMLGSALGSANVRSLPLQQDPFERKGKLGAVLNEMMEKAIRGGVNGKSFGLFQKKTRK